MKLKLGNSIALSMVAILLLSMMAIFPVHAVTMEVYMVPSANDFNTATVSPSYKWNITFYVKDIPADNASFSFQVKCFFNPAFLNVTGAWLPTKDPTYIYFGKSTVQPPTVIEANYVLMADSILVGASTSGAGPFKLAIAEFHILAAPDKKVKELYSDLNINHVDTYLLNDALQKIEPIIKTDGYVHYVWSAPTTNPDMAVQMIDPGLPGVTLPNPQTIVFDQYHIWNSTTFDVEVKIVNLDVGWALHNATFKLSYNNSLTEIISITMNPAWTIALVDNTTTPGVINVFVGGYTPPPPFGDVLVFVVKLHIINQGWTLAPAADESNLVFSDVVLMDTVGPIPTTPPKNGKVIVWRKLKVAFPWLEPEPIETTLGPDLVVGEQFGKEFVVKVDIKELHFAWEMVAYDIRLTYDPTLLKVVEITEGDFLKNPTWNWYGTFFTAYPQEPPVPGGCPRVNALAAGILLPNPETGKWDQPKPEGNGTLFEVRFKALKQSWVTTYTDTFELYPTFGPWGGTEDEGYIIDAKDPTGYVPVDTNKMVNGTLTILPIAPTGRVIDVWMLNPSLGGQGPGQPADLVLPQMEITLTAKVTYNWQPVSYKKVTFEIVWISGEDPYLWKVMWDDTEDDGHATVTFRMPWTGQNAEQWLGKWRVYVSVTLYDEVVTDYMDFDYDYLIRIWSVATDKLEYYKCNDVKITVNYGTKSKRMHNVTMYATIQDEVGQPIGIASLAKTVGGGAFCHYKNFTDTVVIHVPKWAAAGRATVDVGFVTALPSQGGEAASQPYIAIIWILPLHADDPWFEDP